MSPAGTRAPIVVAIDEVGTARDAVDWASAEAAARRCPLRIVHAFHSPLPVDFCDTIPSVENLFTARTAAEAVVRSAAMRARSIASDVEVSVQPVQATPTRAVLEEAKTARLLVMGSRALSGLRGLLTRSVSIQVAAHAPCPVVIVRPTPPVADPGWSPPRVVVGVDGTSPGVAAVGFALQAARQRGVPLIAVRAWTPDRPADLEAVCGPKSLAEALARRTLERVLDHWLTEFPDVSVHALLVRADPEPALAAQSRGAALLVVGSRGRGHLRGTVLGSVSQAVLRHGHCPLAIVGPDALTVRSPVRSDRHHGAGRERPARRGDTPRDRRRSA